MKKHYHTHYEKLNLILQNLLLIGKPIDIHQIEVNNQELFKQLNFNGKILIIKKLLEDGFIEKIDILLGKHVETGYHISNLGIDFINSGGYLNVPSPNQKTITAENNYTQKQVAIAYYIKGTIINESNYTEILNTYCQSGSKKILQKLYTKNNQLTTPTENKTADTKHLQDLLEAKRLLNGLKDKEAISRMDQIITSFQTCYNNLYK